MVAVLVHEVVGVALVLLAHLLHDALHVLLREVGAAQDYGFSAQTSGETCYDLSSATNETINNNCQALYLTTKRQLIRCFFFFKVERLCRSQTFCLFPRKLGLFILGLREHEEINQ